MTSLDHEKAVDPIDVSAVPVNSYDTGDELEDDEVFRSGVQGENYRAVSW